MKNSQIGKAILHQLSRTQNQVLIAATLYGGAAGYNYGHASPGNVTFDLKATATQLGSIATVTALVTTVSFALVVFTLSQVNGRKHDLYFRFKGILFEFDKFLKDYAEKDPLIHAALALSWDFKFLKLDDFPILDWERRIKAVVTALEQRDEQPSTDTKNDPNLGNRILGFLGYMEDVVSEIGLMCIRQIRAAHFVNLVSKALVLLALLLVVLVLCYQAVPASVSAPMAAAPVFFVSFAALLLGEIAYRLHLEDRENLSFVAWDDDGDGDDDDAPPAQPLEWRRR